MNARLCLVGLLIVLLGGGWEIAPVAAQERPRLPSRQHSTLQSPASVALQTVSRPNVATLRTRDRQRRDAIGPYRYGRTLETDFAPSRHGDWERLPSGDWLWRLRIRSRDAVSLSLGFSRFALPPGAALFLYGPDRRRIRGPYTAADATNGALWTPLVQEEEIVLELTVPRGRRPAVDLVVGTVVHGYRSLDAVRRAGATTKSGTCNLDVACEEADPWRNQVRSVGGYTLQRGQDALFCTGTLVNNTARNGRPFFLTAEHCVQTPEQAESMVFYWNFQVSACRTRGSSENGTYPDSLKGLNWDQTSTGAVLRARYGSVHSSPGISGKPDLALVEVDDAIPDDYNLYLSGWDRADAATQEGVTIHHPQGHGKRISFDEDPTRITAYAEDGGGDTHLRVGNWELGTTEQGSSGSPLFNANQRVVGVLSGGLAGCVDGTAEDNDEPDWYGRLAAGFENGDYIPPGDQQPTTFADVLDPADTGRQALSGRTLQGDSIPPAPVSDFRVAEDGVTPDSVTLRWSASGDDGQEGTAQRYELHYRAEEPIISLSDFRSARPVTNTPRPKAAGTEQSVTISLNQDTSYYFAIRAVDDANQASPLVATDRDVTPVSALRVTTPPSPNPARRQATIRFVVETEQAVRVALFDALGRRVTVLQDRTILPFRQQRMSADVSALSSGIYFLHLRGETAARTERIAVVK